MESISINCALRFAALYGSITHARSAGP
jgi:hypothetical protein